MCNYPRNGHRPEHNRMLESERRDADECACRHSSVTETRPSRSCDTRLWKEMYFSFFIFTRSSQSPERSTAPNKLQLLASAESLGEESNSPLSLQVPDVMDALDGSGILYKLKTFRLSGHFPEPDIATTRDTQELNEHRSVDHGGVPYIQRVCCSISKSEAS